MTLHVDIIFKGQNLQKFIYLTAMQRSDQDAQDVLALADNILQKIKEDHPEVTKLFVKSDNASCYHNSLGPEALYRMCKKYGLSLLRYDFNEPCKGKDQCDRESANAKTILRSYLHAKHDILNADDIAEGLHYGYGMQDTEVCVAENDNTKTTLTGKKTKNFTLYNSFQFCADSMTAWRYFDIGEGVSLPYVGTFFDPAGFKVTRTFSKTEQRRRPKSLSKPRDDRVLRNLCFCDIPGCSQVFEDTKAYEAHCLRDEHDNIIQQKSSMDKVKSSYVMLMKMSTPSASLNISAGSSATNTSMDMACAEYPVMEFLNQKGWALPVRSKFRFNDRQKRILYDLYMQGEKSNKKVTPEQAVQVIRKNLKVEDFVTSQQVKALFSRWTRLQKQGKLNIDLPQVDDEDDDDAQDDDMYNAIAPELNNYVHEQATTICNSLMDSLECARIFSKY